MTSKTEQPATRLLLLMMTFRRILNQALFHNLASVSAASLEDNSSYAAYFTDAKLLSAVGTKVTAEVTRWEQMKR